MSSVACLFQTNILQLFHGASLEFVVIFPRMKRNSEINYLQSTLVWITAWMNPLLKKAWKWTQYWTTTGTMSLLNRYVLDELWWHFWQVTSGGVGSCDLRWRLAPSVFFPAYSYATFGRFFFFLISKSFSNMFPETLHPCVLGRPSPYATKI